MQFDIDMESADEPATVMDFWFNPNSIATTVEGCQNVKSELYIA
jgi:hypothetical protein